MQKLICAYPVNRWRSTKGGQLPQSKDRGLSLYFIPITWDISETIG